MMTNVEKKIADVLENGFDIPYAFKQVLKKETYLLPEEEILDLILLEREYLQEKNESPIHSAAKLLVITSYGLIIAEEGFIAISEDIMGYKILNIPFNKITDIELDVCLLTGVLKVATNAYGKSEPGIKFNADKYYQAFKNFIETLRKQVVLAS
jgi:hypothetical protein